MSQSISANAMQSDSVSERSTVHKFFAGIVLVAMGLLFGCEHGTPESNERAGGNGGAGAQPRQTDVSSSAEDDKQSKESKKQETEQVTTLTISKRIGGVETVIGKITFDGTNTPRLSVEEEGSDGEQLQSDWNKVIAEQRIPIEVREVKQVDGETITEMNAVLVAPDDERYPDAVWSYLESNYGYLVDLDD